MREAETMLSDDELARLNPGLATKGHRREARRAINAAEGWLELGLALAGWEELAALEPAFQTDPDVLMVSARVLVALGRVGEARETVRRLVRLVPALRLALLDDPALNAVWDVT